MGDRKKVCIFAGMIVVAMVWFLFGINPQPKKSGEAKVTSAGKEDRIWEKIYDNGYKAPMVKIGETIHQDTWDYKVHSMRETKKKGNWLNDESFYQCDSNGNVLEDQTLIKVDLSITQKENPKSDLYLNSNTLYLYDKDGNMLAADGEDLAYEVAGASIVKKMTIDCYKFALKKDETIRTNLIYAVPDKVLKKAKYYVLGINNTGMDISGLFPKEHCFIQLNKKS